MFGITRLWCLNFLILQWFGVRLAAAYETIEKRDSFTDKPVKRQGSLAYWIIYFGVVPLTGWWSSYIGPWKQFRVEKSPKPLEELIEILFSWMCWLLLVLLFLLGLALAGAAWECFFQKLMMR